MQLSNLEIVQSAYDAYSRRDAAAAFALFDPDIEIVQTPELPWGGHHRGLDGARNFFQIIASHVTAMPQAESYISAGDDVVALGRLIGKTNATGAIIDIAIVHVWTLNNGRIKRFQAYIDTPAMKTLLGI